MFARTGRFSSRVHIRMFLPGTISPGTICKVNIISFRKSGTECLYDKNCPALAGIPLCRDGTKNGPAKFFPYKRYWTNKEIYTCMARSRLTSRSGVTGPDAPSLNCLPGHLVLRPGAPLQNQMPPFITQVCQEVLKRTFKAFNRLKNFI